MGKSLRAVIEVWSAGVEARELEGGGDGSASREEK